MVVFFFFFNIYQLQTDVAQTPLKASVGSKMFVWRQLEQRLKIK